MEPKPLIDDWLVQLQDSGYRVTGPRRVIVELLAESERALEIGRASCRERV